MRTLSKTLFTLAVASTTLVAGVGVAVADDDEDDRSGISLTAGGGVEGFTGESMRDTSEVNGLWGVHGAVDFERYFVGIEAGYLGSAAKITAPLGNANDATLLGSTVEAIGKVSPLPDLIVQPYAFVGAAWRHYDVTGEDFTTAATGMADADDVFQIPFGAGLGYREGGLVVDARFTYRQTQYEDLVLETDGDTAMMDTWGVTAGLGYEF
jgi:hypothetical protein